MTTQSEDFISSSLIDTPKPDNQQERVPSAKDDFISAAIQQARPTPEPESTLKYYARGAAQLGKGVLESTPVGFGLDIAGAVAPHLLPDPEQSSRHLQQMADYGLISQEEVDQRNKAYEDIYSKYQEYAKNFPTIERLSEVGEDITGLPLKAKYKEQEPLRLSGMVGAFGRTAAEKVLKGAAAGSVSATLREAGLDPARADTIAGLLSQLNPINAAKKLLTKEEAKYVSGLSKPLAAETKLTKYGEISKARQQSKIDVLNSEAAGLTKEIYKKKFPVAQKIEEGFDFGNKFETGFNELLKMSKKANPKVETTPITEFALKTAEKYADIPSLHPEANQIMKEVEAISKNADKFENTYNALRQYRSYNKKIRGIHERAYIDGKQTELVDFYRGMQGSIRKSFRETFPKDSKFVNLFEDLNQQFSEYAKALETQSKLRPLLDGNPTPANLKKFIDNPKLQKSLKYSMGEEASQDIIQIAKDLQDARKAIKDIPVKDLTKINKVFPLVYFVPGLRKIAGVGIATKAGQRGLGLILSKNTPRTAYQNAVKALINKDPKAYESATRLLKKEIEED